MSAAIAALEAQIKRKREEYERLRATLTSMNKIQADIVALQRSLAILREENGQKPRVQSPLVEILDDLQESTRKKSIPDLAYAVLKEAGKPMTGEQLLPLIIAKGKNMSRQTLLGALYRCANDKRFFKVGPPGVFGLLEWEKKGQ